MSQRDYKIEQRDGEWCVTSEDGSRDLGCYPSEDQARERLRQVEAAVAARNSVEDLEDDPAAPPAAIKAEDDVEDEPDERQREYARLSGIEIFRTGTWNGDKYNARDLDEMVSAFDKVGYRVPIKLGHKENSGDPAYGWVEHIRRVGDRLIADFGDLPDKLFDLIKERRFDSVSSEIFWNLKRGEKTFRRALKAVALLGAEIPAVAGLKPLRESLEVNALEAECHEYQIGTKELDMSDQKQPEKKTEGDDQAVEALQEEIKTLKAALEEKSKDDSAVHIAELQETVKALQEQTKAAQERERQTQIHAKVEKISVPAFRSHFAALYDLATSVEPTKTVKFSVYDDKEERQVEKDTNPMAVLDDLAKRVNKHSEKLFRELGDAGDFRRDDQPRTEDPGQELDKLAKAYQAKHPDKSYAECFSAIKADPENREIVAAYARS